MKRRCKARIFFMLSVGFAALIVTSIRATELEFTSTQPHDIDVNVSGVNLFCLSKDVFFLLPAVTPSTLRGYPSSVHRGSYSPSSQMSFEYDDLFKSFLCICVLIALCFFIGRFF